VEKGGRGWGGVGGGGGCSEQQMKAASGARHAMGHGHNSQVLRGVPNTCPGTTTVTPFSGQGAGLIFLTGEVGISSFCVGSCCAACWLTSWRMVCKSFKVRLIRSIVEACFERAKIQMSRNPTKVGWRLEQSLGSASKPAGNRNQERHERQVHY